MGYGVIIYGDLTLDSRSLDAWKRTKLDATKLAKGDLAMSKELVFIEDDEATVASFLPRLPNASLDFVRVSTKDGALVIRGAIDEDRFRDIGPEIAALAVAAGAAGGHGELFFTSQEEDFLVTVSVQGARVKATRVHGFENPKGWRLVDAARKSVGYRDVIEAIAKGLVEARGPRPAPRPAGMLDEERAALHRECIARLAREPEKALMKALDDHVIVLQPGMPEIPSARGTVVELGVFPTKDALVRYLEHPFVPCAKAALTLCAQIDPDAAETLAIRYASRPIDDDLADGIARALASRASDASLDAAIALLEQAKTFESRHTFARCVRTALATSKNERAGDRALALLKKHPTSEKIGVAALIFAVGKLRCTGARDLLKTLSKNVAFKRDAMIALQTIKTR
jgi:hypothetical protein